MRRLLGIPYSPKGPVIAVGFLAMSAALDHLLLYEGCPLRDLCPCLVSLAVALGPALCDACGGLKEWRATWIPGQEYPTQAELDRELELMRMELAKATTPMVQWQLSLARAEGIRFDVFQHAVLLTMHDLTYIMSDYDIFMAVQMIRNSKPLPAPDAAWVDRAKARHRLSLSNFSEEAVDSGP